MEHSETCLYILLFCPFFFTRYIVVLVEKEDGKGITPTRIRFHPTDEELVGYYPKLKLEGLEIKLEVIPEVNLYKFDPWELPGNISRNYTYFF